VSQIEECYTLYTIKKVKEMEEKTDGLRNVGLRFLKSAIGSDRFLKNEEEIKTESLLYGLS
jgi:hypothetical protein